MMNVKSELVETTSMVANITATTAKIKALTQLLAVYTSIFRKDVTALLLTLSRRCDRFLIIRAVLTKKFCQPFVTL